MSDPQDAPGRGPDTGEDEEEEEHRTPFDNPYFLPVLLVLGTIWFGYDGFFNPDPDMQEHWVFNRVGAVVLGIGALWSVLRAVRRRGDDEEEPPRPASPTGD